MVNQLSHDKPVQYGNIFLFSSFPIFHSPMAHEILWKLLEKYFPYYILQHAITSIYSIISPQITQYELLTVKKFSVWNNPEWKIFLQGFISEIYFSSINFCNFFQNLIIKSHKILSKSRRPRD